MRESLGNGIFFARNSGISSPMERQLVNECGLKATNGDFQHDLVYFVLKLSIKRAVNKYNAA